MASRPPTGYTLDPQRLQVLRIIKSITKPSLLLVPQHRTAFGATRACIYIDLRPLKVTSRERVFLLFYYPLTLRIYSTASVFVPFVGHNLLLSGSVNFVDLLHEPEPFCKFPVRSQLPHPPQW